VGLDVVWLACSRHVAVQLELVRLAARPRDVAVRLDVVCVVGRSGAILFRLTCAKSILLRHSSASLSLGSVCRSPT
jgi:hypothetical protein